MNATVEPLSDASIAPPLCKRPLYLNPVVAGFPNPAEDHLDKPIDLNELLVKNPPATFYVRVQGDSMVGIGIMPGDVLVVDRSLRATHRKVVIAVVDGEFTVKRLIKKRGCVELHSENPDYPPIVIQEGQDLEVVGVVTGAVRDQL